MSSKQLKSRDIAERLKLYFSEKPYISFAYIFGSFARNEMRPLSDIDVAIFVNQKSFHQDLFRLRLTEMTQLYNFLQTEKIDLVLLNEVPVDLGFRILKEGELIFERDAQIRIEYQERIVRDYLDRQYFIQNRNAVIRQQMIEGSYFD